MSNLEDKIQAQMERLVPGVVQAVTQSTRAAMDNLKQDLEGQIEQEVLGVLG